MGIVIGIALHLGATDDIFVILGFLPMNIECIVIYVGFPKCISLKCYVRFIIKISF